MRTKQTEKKKGKRTGGVHRKAALSAKNNRTAAITGDTAQFCDIPPRNEGDRDVISVQQQISSSSVSNLSKISIQDYFEL